MPLQLLQLEPWSHLGQSTTMSEEEKPFLSSTQLTLILHCLKRTWSNLRKSELRSQQAILKSWPSHAINLAIISLRMELLILKIILPVNNFITIIGLLHMEHHHLPMVLSLSHFSKELTLKLKEFKRMTSSNGWKVTELTFSGTSTKFWSTNVAKSSRITITLSNQTVSEQTSRPSWNEAKITQTPISKT